MDLCRKRIGPDFVQPRRLNWLRIWELAFLFATLCITIWIGVNANRIAEDSVTSERRLTQGLRAVAIRPLLRASSRRTTIGSNEAVGLLVTLENIGTGTAKDIIIIVRFGKQFIQTSIEQLYEPGVLPVLSFPFPKGTRLPSGSDGLLLALYGSPKVPEGYTGQNYLMSEQKLEFQLGCWPVGNMPTFLDLVLSVSYFDIDGNEYLDVAQMVPGLARATSGIDIGCGIFDSLSSRSANLGLYEHRSFRNTNYRIQGGFFRDEVLLGDTANQRAIDTSD